MLLDTRGQWADTGGGLALLAFVLFGITLVLVHYPPDWLKPQWLREEERTEQQARP